MTIAAASRETQTWRSSAAAPTGTVAITVEAKADEPFGETVAEALAAALERQIENPRSQAVLRIEQLASALFRPRQKGQPALRALRYQLLTATAGTLAYAIQQQCPVGFLLLHEFITDKTKDELHARNKNDYNHFVHRIRGSEAEQGDLHALLGPFTVPGAPLFESSRLVDRESRYKSANDFSVTRRVSFRAAEDSSSVTIPNC